MTHLARTQRALQAHIVDGDGSIATSIDASNLASVEFRLKVYSDAYRVRLIEALQANFPVLAAYIGADAFARLAQQYLAVHPSRHYSVRWFGHRLADFLCDFDEYHEQPWLAELAAWEWKTALAFDAADVAPLTIEDMATVQPGDWPQVNFAAHPSVQRIVVTSNVPAIVKAHGDDTDLPVAQAIASASNWIIWRVELAVQYRSLEPMEAAALDALLAGATFGEICIALADYCETDAVPVTAASLLKTWISEHLLATPLRIAPNRELSG